MRLEWNVFTVGCFCLLSLWLEEDKKNVTTSDETVLSDPLHIFTYIAQLLHPITVYLNREGVGTFQKYNQLNKPLSNNCCGHSSTGCSGVVSGVVGVLPTILGGVSSMCSHSGFGACQCFLLWKWDTRAKWLECDADDDDEEEEEEESLRARTGYPCMSMSFAKYSCLHILCFFSQLVNALITSTVIPVQDVFHCPIYDNMFTWVLRGCHHEHFVDAHQVHTSHPRCVEQEMNCAVWHDRWVEVGLFTLCLDNLNNMFVQTFGHPESGQSSGVIHPNSSQTRKVQKMSMAACDDIWGSQTAWNPLQNTSQLHTADGVWHSKPQRSQAVP